MISCRVNGFRTAVAGSLLFLMLPLHAANTSIITVADASLAAAFYSDSSCLLTIDSLAQPGKTVIDADVDDQGSRMLIHCDTEKGRRLTLLARGDTLNISQRVPLLSREQINEGSYGMIAWLTRSGVQYSDDSAPRRYVIGGNVMLTRSSPVDVAGYALHTERRAFARISGVLEPIVKADEQQLMEPVDTKQSAVDDENEDKSDSTSASGKPSSTGDEDSDARQENAPGANGADRNAGQARQPASGS